MEEEEEGPFLKKLRGMRAEAVAREQRRLEAAMPAPPGLSLAEIQAATPALLTALEHAVAEAVQANPCATSVDILLAGNRMTVSGTEFVTPHDGRFGTDNNSAWWSAVCAWGSTHIPSNGALAKRYQQFVRQCFKAVADVWCSAHPKLAGYMDMEDGVLNITIPDESSRSCE
jgi:hypothetical protein